MNKKTGIITFHRALNYGAILQTYALQQYLYSINIENEVIDYVCENIEKSYKPFKVNQGKYLKAIGRGILFSRNISKKKKNFNQFMKKYLIMSKQYNSIEELEQTREDYNNFITGSDQVWNPVIIGQDSAYFLSFAHDRQKNSYAASIGLKGITPRLADVYKNSLQSFHKLSVREQDTKTLLQDHVMQEIQTHVDPTLLLSSKQWKAICQEPAQKGYVLIFNVEKPINDIQVAKKIAQERNLKLIYINDRTVKKEKGIEYVVSPTPEAFLGYFAYADIVVTNSFHGTAFSIIFHKNLFVELENMKTRNIRAESLLNLVGIKERTIGSSMPEHISYEPINWERVDEVLNIENERSKRYLKSLSGEFD